MVAVRGTSFGVKKGEIFTLLGVNGAGKSSLLKCLIGLENSNGEINIGDEDLTDGTNLHGVIGYCP